MALIAIDGMDKYGGVNSNGAGVVALLTAGEWTTVECRRGNNCCRVERHRDSGSGCYLIDGGQDLGRKLYAIDWRCSV